MRSCAIGADQGKRLLPFETVSRYRFAHSLLSRFVERTKRVRQRDPHIAHVDETDYRFAKPLGQHQSGRHPERLSAKDAGNPLGTEPLHVAHGMHHPGFIHRRERACRTICFEKRDLLLQGGKRFRYHRHIRKSRFPPSFKTFETVDDLVKTVCGLHDTERQITELNRPLGRCPAA